MHYEMFIIIIVKDEEYEDLEHDGGKNKYGMIIVS